MKHGNRLVALVVTAGLAAVAVGCGDAGKAASPRYSGPPDTRLVPSGTAGQPADLGAPPKKGGN